jgi:hypothetical protein
MLVESLLAINAARRHDAVAVRTWVGKAIAHADDLRARANGVSDKDQFAVLRLAARLTVAGGGAPLVDDLPKRIDAALTELAARRDPALRTDGRWLEILGPLVVPTGANAVRPKAPAAPTR